MDRGHAPLTSLSALVISTSGFSYPAYPTLSVAPFSLQLSPHPPLQHILFLAIVIASLINPSCTTFISRRKKPSGYQHKVLLRRLRSERSSIKPVAWDEFPIPAVVRDCSDMPLALKIRCLPRSFYGTSALSSSYQSLGVSSAATR